MKLPNIPGRCLIQLNKHTYESQMYLSFEGEKEFERVQKIQDFVKKQNEKYTGMKAAIIPEIPKRTDTILHPENLPGLFRGRKSNAGT